MPKRLTFEDLERSLVRAGFVLERANGGHRVFRHAAADALVVLPVRPGGSPVDDAHLVAVRRMLREKGIVEDDAFERLLQPA